MATQLAAPEESARRPHQPRLLGVDDREAVLAFLSEAPELNLTLIESTRLLATQYRPHEVPPTLYGVFVDGVLSGVASFRPSLNFSAGMSTAALDALLPLLRRIPNGLLKCECDVVDRVWPVLADRGRRTMIDRVEIAYRLTPAALSAVLEPLPGVARPAREEDLEDLVYAARASLWEEDRPDPAEGDPVGFRRWVSGRLERARVVVDRGELVFVSYADVRLPEGWLIQGVYTWPAARRRGFAKRGMDFVIREAFASGAAHVQLAVVEGNDRATALYRDLGFEPFQRLRTILFH